LSHAREDDSYRVHREALRRRVCAVCLDGADDGRCSLTVERRCPIEEHLRPLVDTLLELRSRHDTRYAQAIDARVCSLCTHRDASSGRCQMREDGRCALSVYLPLIAEAAEEAEASLGSAQA
jgi:hypothetical protein